LLGSGATGSVWLADDEVLRRAVALKQLHTTPTSTLTVLAEARAAAQVAHPGIVRVHDVIVGEGSDWIVMEALAGKTLSETIVDRGRLSIAAVADIGLQLLSALEAIHDADLVHGDVKPGNIQMCDGDRAVLTDFGLSSPPAVLGGVSVGTVRGSLPYLAPETIIHGAFGPASDLYALGVTLYSAVEGRRPFDPGTPVTLMESALERTPSRPVHAGAALGEVLAGLLHNDPRRRLDVTGARTRLQLVEAGVDGSGMSGMAPAGGRGCDEKDP
jgi:eukaryotic-like serine/threonine-protein kinase